MDDRAATPVRACVERVVSPAMPGVAALRAFVLTLETSSFSRAAELIGVTHAAVIQQVRALEARMGAVLVERDGKQLKATARGTELFLRMREHVHALEDIFLPAPAVGAGRRLRINTTPCFASGWLLRRLPRLRELFPGIEFVLDTDISVVDPVASRMDLAIRHGAGSWPGLRPRWLFGECAVPVALPRFGGDGARLAAREVLALPLIENPMFPWRAFAAEHGLRAPGRFALVVNDSFVAQQAAEAGVGVALARGSLVGPPAHARLGRIADAVPVDAAWWLCLPVARQRDRLTEAVADAILRLAAVSASTGAGAGNRAAGAAVAS